MKIKRKLLALVLAMALALSAFPVLPAAAAETTAETTAPTEEITAPAETASDPLEESTDPSGETTAPTEETTAPAEDATEPAGDTTDPTQETTAPVEDATEPVEEATVPEETTAPAEETTVLTDAATEASAAFFAKEPGEVPAEPIPVETGEWSEAFTDFSYEIYEIPAISALSLEGYSDEDTAALELRDQLKQRNPEFTIRVRSTENLMNSFPLYDLAVAHTGSPVEGDYIKYHVRKASVLDSSYYYQDGNDYYYTLNYSIVYNSSAAQEEEMAPVLASVMDQLDLTGKSDYQKVKAIYDYITHNVTYDHEHLNDTSYNLMYSAYAALIHKTCVCQGYANLFYRMALMAGIDCRIIDGTGNGGAHAWNIVRIGSVYYDVDSTWDASYAEANLPYKFFLRCDANFGDHSRSEGHSTQAFYAQYPMSPTDHTEPTEPEPGEELEKIHVGDSRTLTLQPEQEVSFSFIPEVGGGYVFYANSRDDLGMKLLKDGKSVARFAVKPISLYERYTGDYCVMEAGQEYIFTVYNFQSTEITGTVYLDAYVRPECLTLETFDAAQESKIGLSVVKIAPENSFIVDGITWEISDPSVVSIDSTWGWGAYFSILKPGTTTITATTADGVSGSYQVTAPDLNVDPSKKCGENLTWTLDEATGTLTILGMGAMYDYYNCPVEDIPWYDQRSLITSVVLTDGVTVIGGNVFNGCENLKSITIPDSVRGIGPGAFWGCSSLESVALPDDLQYFDAWVFTGCEKLKEIILPRKMTSISAFTFCGCVSLENVSIPDSVTTIALSAFLSCESLESITVPAGVTEIGESAFGGCTGLKKITFQGNAPKMTEDAFRNVTATAYYPANDPTWTADVMQDYGGHITWRSDNEPNLPGDVNGDGEVNAADRMMLARYLAEWPGYTEENVDLDAADLNSDGKVDSKDRMILARYLAKWPGYEKLPRVQ